MPEEVDSLILEASVVDDFSDQLEELKGDLMEIAFLEEAIFPIDGEIRAEDAIAEVKALDAALKSLDDEIDIDVDVDKDIDDTFGIATGESGFDESVLPFGAGLDEHDPAHFNPIGAAALVDPPGGDDGGRDRSFTGRMHELARDFSKLRLTMGGFMTLLANLIPLLAVFVGALPAAIAGIGALAAAALTAAGALYGFVGLGLLGLATTGGEFDFDQMREQVQGLIDQFLMAFTPLANAILPTIQEGISRLGMLFRDTAVQAQLLLRLTQDVGELMQFVSSSATGLTADIAMFADAAMPLLLTMMRRLGAVDWFSLFAGVLAETLPLLFNLTTAIGRMLPGLFNLSMGFLAVATVITSAISRFVEFITLSPILARGIGVLIAGLLTLITVTGLYSVATSSLITKIGALILEHSIYLTALYEHIAAMTGATVATLGLAAASAILLGILTFGVIPAIMGTASGFNVLGSDIKSATERLREYSQMSRRVSPPGLGSGELGGTGGPSYSRPSNATVVAPDQETGNAVANTFRFGNQPRTTDGNDVDNRFHSK